MNWLPIRHASGTVTTRKMRLRISVGFRYRRQNRRTGRYKAWVHRETGFSDSGLRWPRMKITIRTGTSVMARIEENATERVLVHARGRNMRPSCASRRNTGRNDTMITSKEKKMASASPPSDMMFALTCRKYMGMKDARTAMGRVRIGMSAERKWNKKTIVTKLTMMASSRRSRCSVSVSYTHLRAHETRHDLV